MGICPDFRIERIESTLALLDPASQACDIGVRHVAQIRIEGSRPGPQPLQRPLAVLHPALPYADPARVFGGAVGVFLPSPLGVANTRLGLLETGGGGGVFGLEFRQVGRRGGDLGLHAGDACRIPIELLAGLLLAHRQGLEVQMNLPKTLPAEPDGFLQPRHLRADLMVAALHTGLLFAEFRVGGALLFQGGVDVLTLGKRGLVFDIQGVGAGFLPV